MLRLLCSFVFSSLMPSSPCDLELLQRLLWALEPQYVSLAPAALVFLSACPAHTFPRAACCPFPSPFARPSPFPSLPVARPRPPPVPALPPPASARPSLPLCVVLCMQPPGAAMTWFTVLCCSMYSRRYTLNLHSLKTSNAVACVLRS